jgi:hypothetical protein
MNFLPCKAESLAAKAKNEKNIKQSQALATNTLPLQDLKSTHW